VTKTYLEHDGEVRALDDVSFSVKRGEFVVVRGPSGSGKSTLLLIVGGLVRPTRGKVMVDGSDLCALTGRQRARFRAEKVGFVFQMYHLVPYLNVLENVVLATIPGPRKGQRARAPELLERLRLSDRLRHRPADLSAGERQRVAIARALLNRPSVILADEPTGNLDPDNAEHVLGYLAEFHRAGGTILLVTHERSADRYAQRIMLLDKGRMSFPDENR